MTNHTNYFSFSMGMIKCLEASCEAWLLLNKNAWTRHYRNVHQPPAVWPVKCLAAACQWFGRVSNESNKHACSTGHKKNRRQFPHIQDNAIANPNHIPVPEDKCRSIIQLHPADLAPPKPLIRPMETTLRTQKRRSTSPAGEPAERKSISNREYSPGRLALDFDSESSKPTTNQPCINPSLTYIPTEKTLHIVTLHPSQELEQTETPVQDEFPQPKPSATIQSPLSMSLSDSETQELSSPSSPPHDLQTSLPIETTETSAQTTLTVIDHPEAQVQRNKKDSGRHLLSL